MKIKDPTCYKNFNNPSCIDLFLTNSVKRFEGNCIVETDLSHFHKLVVTVLTEKRELLPQKELYNSGTIKALLLRYI